MSKRDERSAKLLAETLHGDWIAGRPAEFARAAAAVARSRQRTRKLAAVAGALAAVAIGTFVALRQASEVERVRSATQQTGARVQPSTAVRGYEIISDEELLAQVRDRPLLAVARADGRREIVVLANE